MSSTNRAAAHGIKSVLIAYDFSDASRKPLHHAIEIARHFGAKLHIAYVVSSLGYGIAGPEASQLASEGSQRDIRQLEADLQKMGALKDLEYELILREGDVWKQLAQVVREKHVDAVVVGTHARGGIGRLALGSVAEQVFRQAHCLVLTVGPGSHENTLMESTEAAHPILLATDFGPASLRALPYAASFTKHFSTKLVVLHVLPAAPIPEGFHWSTTGDLMQMREQAETASRKEFERLILPNVPPETAIEFAVKFGIANEQILQACHMLKADLLILGLNRSEHIQAASHMPGSLAHQIVSAASCPVLTVKTAATQSAIS
jgi:nucleotide-binding universal stress UspA family protein